MLNLLFRIGIKTQVELTLTPEDPAAEKVFDFMEIHGASWGARKEVIARATSAVNEFMEGARALELTEGDVTIAASFDEFNLGIDIGYQGRLMEFPTVRPSEEELLADPAAIAGLAGFLVRSYADRIQSSSVNGTCRVHLHFEH